MRIMQIQSRAVWPDAEIKSGPIFSKVAQNVAKLVFVSKGTFYKRAQKSFYIWATSETNISPRTLENRQILSHWSRGSLKRLGLGVIHNYC